MRLADRVVDLDRGEVRRGEDVVALTAIEIALLRYLEGRAGRTVTRDELLREVWRYAPRVRSRSVDHTVARLRRKLERDPAEPAVLVSVFGVGYRLDLPAPFDPSLVGRGRELAVLRDRLRGARLVTLVGPGGAGKTSLARRLATDAVWVALEPARDPGDVVRLVAVALGVDLPPAADPVEVVGRALAARGRAVLVLDELEHVLAAADAVDRWLARAPDLAIVGTSRAPLGLPGEDVLPVGPLAEDDAVALLAARLGRPPDPEVARRLVRALDGLPLAIELAAARCRVIEPEALLARLDADTLSVPDGVGRHASVRALLAGSWEALSGEDRRLLAACTTFVGPFDAAAAEAVAGFRPLDGLERLVRASLVVRWTGPVRFGLLATVRAFAEPHRTGDDVRRHAGWAVTAAEALSERLRFVRQDPDTYDRLEAQAPELLVLGDRRPGPALEARALVALLALVEGGRPLPDLRARLAGLRSVPDELRARVAWTAGRLAYVAGRPLAEIEPHLGDALARAVPARDRAAIASARGDARQGAGRYDEALADYASAIADYRESACVLGEATVRSAIGLVRIEQGRPDEADEALREALALHRSIGSARGVAMAHDRLATCASLRGETEEGLARATEALEEARAIGDRRLEAIFLTHLGNALKRGRTADAESTWRVALQAHRAQGNPRFEAVTLGNLASLWLDRGELREARDALDLARVLARSVGDRGMAASLVGNLAEVHRRRGDLEAAERCARDALDEHRALGRARAAAYARLNLALVLRDRGDLAAAGSELRELAGSVVEPVRASAREALAQMGGE